jgi:hypothetical protein
MIAVRKGMYFCAALAFAGSLFAADPFVGRWKLVSDHCWGGPGVGRSQRGARQRVYGDRRRYCRLGRTAEEIEPAALLDATIAGPAQYSPMDSAEAALPVYVHA